MGDVANHPSVVDGSARMVDGLGVPMAIRSEPQPLQRPHWIPDERDAFISWLRGEFAAANAIIDAMCQHLQMTGMPGEYDFVLACIHQRRFNWNPVLHMQQYYSVAEVLMSLQQVSLKRHQGQMPLTKQMSGESVQTENMKPVEDGQTIRAGLKEGGKSSEEQENRTLDGMNHVTSLQNDQLPEVTKGNSQNTMTPTNTERKTMQPAGSVVKSEKFEDASITRKTSNVSISEEDSKCFPPAKAPKYFVGFEEIEGQQVNVMEGLELHENVFDSKEAAEIAVLVNESHAANSKSKVRGNKQSTNGKEKDLIQFGTIPSEILAEERKPSAVFREETAEAMPAFLESVMHRLIKSQVIPADKRPDACSISVLEAGDYMPPHNHHNFDRPIFILSLGSDSILAFGRSLKLKSMGEVDGPFKLALTAGSVLVLQRNSAEIVQCAVSPSQNVRTLVTFGKMSKRISKTTAFPSPPLRTSAVQSEIFSKQGPRDGHGYVLGAYPPLRTQSVTPPPTVLPVAPARSPGQVIQTQPMIIPTAGAVVPYSPVAVVAPGWSSSSPRVPTTLGTGVFLPPNGPAVYSPQQMNGYQRRQAAAPHLVPQPAASNH